ncbi:MAG: glycosyltransferase family 4 protein [Promethearchaeota archaeon]
MNIGIDVRLLEKKMTGIGRFLNGILKFIPKLDSENEYFLFSLNKLENYKKKDFNVIATGNNNLFPSKVYSPIWINFVLPRYLKKYNIDLFFSPSGLIPLANITCKTIILLCDVFHRIGKDFHPYIYRKYLDLFLNPSIKNSDLIISISQNSKKDIIDFYNVSPEKIKVIYFAAEKKFQRRTLPTKKKEYFRKKYNLPPKFILYVGIVDYRKNIDAIIEVGNILINEKKKKVYFVLIGKPGLRYKELIRKSKKIKSGHILFLNYVEEEDLPFLYNLADIFFFPSLYEGFGLPPLEAMQSGVPVLTSNTSSLPEVVGNEGIMKEPQDYEGFAKDIIKFLEDKDFYQKMKDKAILQAKKFSWQKATKSLVELFNSI